MAEAVGRLSPDHRQMIVETYLRGRSYDELAAECGVAPATLRSRAFDAMKALRVTMEQMGGDTVTTEHQQLRELLGAYALDQLDEPTRTSVRRHLAGCADCRAELRDLAPVVDALRGLDPDSVEAVPPVHLGDLVSARERAAVRRARLRRAGAGALVAALIAAFAAGGWYAGSRLDPPVEDITLQASQAGLRSEGGLVRHTWGTELKLEAATGFTDGATYTVSFLRDHGTRVAGGSFLGTGERPIECSLNAAIARDAATEVRISDPRGGVVMDAQLS